MRGIGSCYGFTGDTEREREFVLSVLAVAGASSVAQKQAALVTLRQLQITIARQTFKKMAETAAQRTLGFESAIIAARDLAKSLGVNLSKRKMLQAVPVVGAGVGAAVNVKFMSDVAWAARRAYQGRWLEARDSKV